MTKTSKKNTETSPGLKTNISPSIQLRVFIMLRTCALDKLSDPTLGHSGSTLRKHQPNDGATCV